MKVAERIAHRGDVTDLTGEVEDDVGIGDRLGNDRLADLRLDDLDVEPFDVATVAAVPVDQGVDDRDVGAMLDQPMREVRADEAEATGHNARSG